MVTSRTFLTQRCETRAAAVLAGLRRLADARGCVLGMAVALTATLVIAASGFAAAVRAEPLSAQACLALELEREALNQLGAQNLMARGPDWAKRNLIPPEREMVKRYLSLQGELRFRCGKSVLKGSSGS